VKRDTEEEERELLVS